MESTYLQINRYHINRHSEVVLIVPDRRDILFIEDNIDRKRHETLTEYKF